MNSYFTQARRAIPAVIGAMVMAILSGCSKPPACGDDATLKLAQELVTESVTAGLGTYAKDDPDGWMRKYLGSLKMDLTRIVSEGYQADAKKQSCRAAMKLKSLSGETQEVSVAYATQMTEDRDAQFVIEVNGAVPLVKAMQEQAREYYQANRWAGEWSGTYTCGGIRQAQEGPQGPFVQRVTLTVKGNEGHMERTTQGGGYEKLGGNFVLDGQGNTKLEIAGPGQNTPSDQWVAEFEGPVEGNRARAAGVIRFRKSYPREPEVVLRECKLDLTLNKPKT